MRAVVLSCGDELVLGQTVDTNSAYLSAELAKLGIMTLYHQTLPDDQAATAAAISQASQMAELVIVSGGLGPTEDDLTRQALAQAIGAPLALDQESLQAIAGFFSRRNRPMPERNKIQAMRPAGATMIPNSCGTAPGLKACLHRATVYVVPGVPSEMVAMYQQSIAPDLQAQPTRGVILSTRINTFGMGESSVAELLGLLMERTRNPLMGTTVSGGCVSVRIRSQFTDARQAQGELDRTAKEVESRLGPSVFGREEQTLQQSLVHLLKERHLTVATAESCTGGALGKAITDVPGSSAVYLGGWVTYSNAMKQAQLGVPADLLAQHGAVSQPVVRAMARGAVERSGADLALTVTGVAGPEGGTAQKPVGLVWIGLAYRPSDAPGGIATEAMVVNLPGERDMVRDRAAKCALQLLRFHLLGVGLEALLWGRRVKEES